MLRSSVSADPQYFSSGLNSRSLYAKFSSVLIVRTGRKRSTKKLNSTLHPRERRSYEAKT